jgi:DNA-binding IscR family transcriptional regulator
LLSETTDQKLVPARDPRTIDVTDIIAAVRRGERVRVTDGKEDWNQTVDSIANRIDQAIEQALAGRTLADLVEFEMRHSQTTADQDT